MYHNNPGADNPRNGWVFLHEDALAPMDGETNRPVRAWQRSGTDHSPDEDDGGLPLDDLNIHQYCAVYPYQPDDDPELRTTDGGDLDVRLVRGVPRWGLRNTPLVILVMTILFFGSAEFWPGVAGVSSQFVTLSMAELATLVAVAAVLLVVSILLIQIGILDIKTLYTGGIVYGLVGFLLAGTVYSAILVAVSYPTAPGPNVVFASGYLLLMLIGGLLVYDCVLRTEHMIETLPETHIVADTDKYLTLAKELSSRLDRAVVDTEWTLFGRRVRIPTSHAIATVAVVTAVAVWTITQGPQNLDFPITILGNAVINFVAAIVGVQFLIVVAWLYELTKADITGGDRPSVLTYKVYHPDGHGGYRDLGKFVTRVNLLFIITGVYAVYRLYVHGLRAAPADITSVADPTVSAMLWVLNFGGPVVIYPFFIGVWLYYSVWQIHLRMIRERERTYAETTDRFDTDADWHIRTNGSVWPFDSTQVHSLLYGHLWPVILTFLPLLVSRLFLS